MPKKAAPAATTADVEIVFVNHTRDHVPGDRATVSPEEARRLVRGYVAQYATKTDAKAAAEPDGPTPRSS